VLTALEAVGRQRPGSPMDVLFRDPRWRIEYGDGRRVVTHEAGQYDVIEADAILPESSQSGVLYSVEFLEQVRERLAPGGIYVQWAPTPRSVETFAAAFPHAVMLRPVRIMIGSREPIPLDREALLRRLAEPAVASHLARGRTGCCDWAAMIGEPPLVWGPGDARKAAPLTDLFPRDEFYLNTAWGR
jgi:hypothetical protein